MFTLGTEWWHIVIRTTVVYIAIVLALRLTGRRSLGQRNAVDLVLILIVANAVQNAMIGADTSLIGGLIAAGTLFVVDSIMTRLLRRNTRLKTLFTGGPVVLVNKGHIIEPSMNREGITYEELMESLREHGIEGIAQVKLCVLEMDGSLSIVPATSTSYRSRRKIKGHQAPVGPG